MPIPQETEQGPQADQEETQLTGQPAVLQEADWGEAGQARPVPEEGVVMVMVR